MVEVRGVPILYRETKINDYLGYTFWTSHDLEDKIKKNTLDDLKGWLAPLISNEPPTWLEEGAVIGKRS